MHRSALLFLILGAAALTGGASAGEPPMPLAGRYRIAPASTIAFTVPQVGGGGIAGRFMEFSGSIDLHPEAVARSVVSFTLKPASVTTGQARVDAFLRSDAVFDAAAFPAITFRSSRVTPDGDEGAIVAGVLTAHGIAHPETFHVELLRQEPRGVDFHVVGKILRSRYGMDIGTPIYSNVVSFDMVVKGERR